MKSITERQKEILKFIQDFMAENKYAPSIREIGAACNIESTHGVTCHLQAIEKKGYITRKPNKARSIVLVNW